MDERRVTRARTPMCTHSIGSLAGSLAGSFVCGFARRARSLGSLAGSLADARTYLLGVVGGLEVECAAVLRKEPQHHVLGAPRGEVGERAGGAAWHVDTRESQRAQRRGIVHVERLIFGQQPRDRHVLLGQRRRGHGEGRSTQRSKASARPARCEGRRGGRRDRVRQHGPAGATEVEGTTLV